MAKTCRHFVTESVQPVPRSRFGLAFAVTNQNDAISYGASGLYATAGSR